MAFKPWHHQTYTANKFAGTRIGLDLSDPGTGKTGSHLHIYGQRPHRGRALVVAPMTLMRAAWGADIDKFFPELTYTIADAKNRFEAFEADSDIVIINIDGVKALTRKFKRANQLQKFMSEFDHLIVDEISFYKHASSQRSKAMLQVSREMPWRFGLSGTPNPRSVTELWQPMMILDRGRRLGTSFFAFRNGMQVSEQVGPRPEMVKWTDKPMANDVVMNELEDIVVRHAFEEVMTDVPANHIDTKRIVLTPKLWKMYKQLENEMSLMTDQALVQATGSSLRNKLLQLCSGAVYSGDGGYVLLDGYRYQLIADLIEERDHSVTFFNWRHQKEELRKHLDARKISYEVIDGSVPDRKRTQIVADYQRGMYQTLLINYKTGAHGLTLTRGTTSIICSPIYEADYFKQTIHRIYRGGQTEKTNTLLVCAAGTVEELVYERLRTNTMRMAHFLQLVQEAKFL